MGSENEVTGMVLRRGPLSYGRPNVIIGGIAIFVAAAGGMVLGFTMDAYFPQGFYALPLTRVLMKAGHTHGMPFALYNLIYGSLIDRLALDGKWKKRGCSRCSRSSCRSGFSCAERPGGRWPLRP